MNYRLAFLSVLFTLVTASLSFAYQMDFSKTVTDEQAATLSSDLAFDWTLYPDTWVGKSIGLSDLTNDSVKLYIFSRVHFIVGQDESFDTNLGVIQKGYTYTNGKVLPDFEKPDPNFNCGDSGPRFRPLFKRPFKWPWDREEFEITSLGGVGFTQDCGTGGKKPAADPDHKPMIVMGNVGTVFYYIGKQMGDLVGYHFVSKTQDGVVPIKSPYAGIIQIGEGLFKIKMNKTDNAALANSIFRVATIFHEAHHSDGNAKSLGFPHAICPRGTSYENLNACDRNGNGPYTAGAGFLKQARIMCVNSGKCSKKDAEVLALAATDSYSRVLDHQVLDATPEGI